MKPTPVAHLPLARRIRPVPRIRVGGVTLIELMVTLAIVAIVAGLGVPSFLSVLARHAIEAQAEELQDAVRVGRNEAMKRAGPVVLCRTEPDRADRCAGNGGSWQTWLLFTDLGRTGTFVAGDAVVRQHVEVSRRMTVAGNAASIRFESTGIAHADVDSPVFTLSPAGAATTGMGGSDRALQRLVCVNPRGEVAVVAGGASCP
jgi:type IV fimbrial biogenesis protein FimT